MQTFVWGLLLDLESGCLESGGLESESLESRATDFGSGSVLISLGV